MADLPNLPGFIRNRIERAIDAAINPKDMSVHDGMARVHSSDLAYMLKLIDKLRESPDGVQGTPEVAPVACRDLSKRLTKHVTKEANMADRKYPRHDFWGAGEVDCPADLKAPNGELCDMRCKVCGDGWRDSRDVCMAALADDPVRAALIELVAVKDIKERAAALHFAGPSGPLGEGWEAEWKRLERDYIERQPKAWAAARAALATSDVMPVTH